MPILDAETADPSGPIQLVVLFLPRGSGDMAFLQLLPAMITTFMWHLWGNNNASKSRDTSFYYHIFIEGVQWSVTKFVATTLCSLQRTESLVTSKRTVFGNIIAFFMPRKRQRP